MPKPLTALLFLTLLNLAQSQTPATCVPGISFWRLLGSLNIGYTSGNLSLGKLIGVCLPKPTAPSNSQFAYDPDGGGKLITLLKRADGQVLGSYVWYSRETLGLWELSDHKVLGGPQAIKPLVAGSYVLEFVVEEQTFYRFPFSVVEVQSDDPYQPPGPRFLLEGAWNRYGNLFFQRNDPESVLRFTAWLQDKAGKDRPRRVGYQLQLIRLQDSKLIGEDTGTLSLLPRWQEVQLYFGEKDPVLAKVVLSQKGSYKVRLMLDGKLYGEYPFEVQGGHIELQGLQLARTNPLERITDYLSGGRYTSWWIERR